MRTGAGHQPKGVKGRPTSSPPNVGSGGQAPKPNGHAPLLDRAQILAVDDLRTERVAVPEWGGDVLIRSVSLAEREAFEQAAGAADTDGSAVIARMVAMAAVDGDGRPLFTPADVAALAAKGAGPIMRLSQVAMRLNGLVASDIEVLVKN